MMPKIDNVTALVPVVINENELFWLANKKYIIAHVRFLEAVFERVCVATSLPQSFSEKFLGGSLEILPGGIEDTVAWLPPGTSSALRLLTENTPVLVSDFRTPCPPESMLQEIVAAWKCSPHGPWTTIATPRDHPCQCFQSFMANDAGYIHFFDDTIPRRGKLIPCRPCMLPIPYLEFDREKELLWFADTLDMPVPESCPSFEDADRLQRTVARFLPSGLCQLWLLPCQGPPQFTKYQCQGRSLFGPESAIFSCGDDEYILTVPSTDTAVWDTLLLAVPSERGFQEIPFARSEQIRFFCKTDKEGLFFAMLSIKVQGKSEVKIDFPTHPLQWATTTDGIWDVNKRAFVYGRQNFPDCFILNGALTMGMANQISDIVDSVDTLQGIVSDGRVKTITNSVEMLEYEIGCSKGSTDVI